MPQDHLNTNISEMVKDTQLCFGEWRHCSSLTWLCIQEKSTNCGTKAAGVLANAIASGPKNGTRGANSMAAGSGRLVAILDHF